MPHYEIERYIKYLHIKKLDVYDYPDTISIPFLKILIMNHESDHKITDIEINHDSLIKISKFK